VDGQLNDTPPAQTVQVEHWFDANTRLLEKAQEAAELKVSFLMKN